VVQNVVQNILNNGKINFSTLSHGKLEYDQVLKSLQALLFWGLLVQ